LSLSAWGRWDDDLAGKVGSIGLEELKLAYIRRKRWEARMLAVEIVSALGQALGSVQRGQGQRTSADGLLAAMGARVE
jgi:hypothetical protein